MMRAEFQHREDLVHFGRLIHQQGFVSACDGNLSVRLDSNTVLATPTSVSKGMMRPQRHGESGHAGQQTGGRKKCLQ